MATKPRGDIVASCLLGGLLVSIIFPSLFFASEAWDHIKHEGPFERHPILRSWMQPVLQTVLMAPFVAFAWIEAIAKQTAESKAHRRPWRVGLCVGWRRFGMALAVGMLSTLPMLALGLISPQQNAMSDWMRAAIMPGVWEEILYRGIVFGGLVQLAHWRIWPAALITGVVFGLAHLVVASVRGMPLGQQIPWLALIGLGGMLYAWLHARWGFNLWLPITLHVFMNGWWTVFDLPNNALGPWAVTTSRILTIGLAITATKVFIKRNPKALGLSPTGNH